MPLHTFWMWWDNHFITLFYGNNLAGLLKVSNTWFSFYANNAPPTIRIFGFFPDSHSFSLFGLIGLPALFALFYFYRQERSIKKEALLGAVLFFDLMTFVLSGTRGIWAAAIVPFLVIVFFIIKKYKPVDLAKLSLAVFIVFIIAFPISFSILSLSQKITFHGSVNSYYEFQRVTSIANLSDISNLGRLEIWKSSIIEFMHHPVLGIGIANFPLALDENIHSLKEGSSAHNLYLNFAVETGIIGLAALLLVFYRLLENDYVTLKKAVSKNNLEKSLIAFSFFFGIALIWIFVYNGVDVVLANDKVLLFFVSQTAILYASSKYLIKNHE